MKLREKEEKKPSCIRTKAGSEGVKSRQGACHASMETILRAYASDFSSFSLLFFSNRCVCWRGDVLFMV